MATKETKLRIVVDAQDKASSTLKNINASLGSITDGMKRVGAVGAASFAGLSAVAYKSIGAYAEAERAQRQLENAVIGVSKGTAAQVKEIEKVAAALEKKAGVDADGVKSGAAQLSTFGLQSKSVVALTKSLTDLTINQNGVNATTDQYIQSANTMAKALQGQFGILEKSGIRFTEAQQNMILYGTEAEKVTALQAGLAQNLRETSDTLGGVDVATARLMRTWEAIQENIGAALVPALNALLDTIMPIITMIADWTEKNPKLAANIFLIALAVSGLMTLLIPLAYIIPVIVSAFGALATVMAFVATGPGIAITGLLVVIGASLGYVGAKLWDLKGDWDLVWLGMKLTMADTVNGIVALFEAMVNAIIGSINNVIKTINSLLSRLASTPVIGKAFKGLKIEEIAQASFSGIDTDAIVRNSSASSGTTVNVNVTGNTLLDEDAGEQLGNMIVKKLQLSNSI